MFAKIKAALLGIVDAANKAAEPFEPFTRALELRPGETLEHDRMEKLAAALDSGLAPFMQDRGLYVYSIVNDLGDLCVHQGIYAAMRVMAYKARPTAEAKQAASDALDALLLFSDDILLRGITPNRYDGTVYKPDESKAGQYWHDTDGRLRREDASLDSLAGWIFGVAMASKYLPLNTEQDRRIGQYAQRFISDGYCLKNRDGSVTRHGDCRPGPFQAPVRNLAATAMARLGLIHRGLPQWYNLARDYAPEFARTETHFLWKQGYYNDNMAILLTAAYCAMTYPNDAGHPEAREGLRILAGKYARKTNPLLVALCKMNGVSVGSRQEELAEQVLLEFTAATDMPNGKGPGMIRNTENPLIKKVEWGGRQYAAQPLPAWQRPPQDFHWQRNPYQLDGATDNRQNSLDFLVAYWARRIA
jgi:hypothetical protein